MTPAKDVFMINIRDNLDYNVLKTIFRSGFSRIPVFDKDRNDIVGILLTKDLLLIDPKVYICHLFKRMDQASQLAKVTGPFFIFPG